MTTPSTDVSEDTSGPTYQGRHRALPAREPSRAEVDHASSISTLLDAHGFTRRDQD